VEDDLMRELKARAQAEQLSVTRMLNRILRLGLEAAKAGTKKRSAYREKPADMGAARVDLTKALRLAGELEDEETAEELRRGK
jgi:hypothetical protein